MKVNDLRRAEVVVGDKWIDIEFEEIRAGNRFRLFESTGEPVVDENMAKVNS